MSKSDVYHLTYPPSYIPPWRAIFEGNEWFKYNKITSSCVDEDLQVEFSKKELKKGFFDVKGIIIPFGDIEQLIYGYYVLSIKSRIRSLAKIKGYMQQLSKKHLTIISDVINEPIEIRNNPYKLLKTVGNLCLNKTNPTKKYITAYISFMKKLDPNIHMISSWTSLDYLSFTGIILYQLFVGGSDMRIIGKNPLNPLSVCLNGELIFWLLHLCNYRLAFFWNKLFQYDLTVNIPFGYNYETFCATISFKWETILGQVMRYINEHSDGDEFLQKILDLKIEKEDHQTWFSSESLYMCHISFTTKQFSKTLETHISKNFNSQEKK